MMADTVTAAYKRYRAHGGGLDRHKHLGSRQPSLNLRHPLLHPQNLPLRDAQTMLAVMFRDKNQTITKSMSFLCAPDTVDPRGPKGK
jgi:hypothetical protein